MSLRPLTPISLHYETLMTGTPLSLLFVLTVNHKIIIIVVFDRYTVFLLHSSDPSSVLVSFLTSVETLELCS